MAIYHQVKKVKQSISINHPPPKLKTKQNIISETYLEMSTNKNISMNKNSSTNAKYVYKANTCMSHNDVLLGHQKNIRVSSSKKILQIKSLSKSQQTISILPSSKINNQDIFFYYSLSLRSNTNSH